MTKVGNGAGFEVCQIWTRNSAGYCTGTKVDGVIAAGQTSHAYMTQQVVTAGLAVADPVEIEFQGGDRIWGRMSFGGGNLNSYDLTSDALDNFLITLAARGNVDAVTNAKWEIFGTNPNEVNLPVLGMALARRFQLRSAGVDGDIWYQNIFMPACTIRPRLGGFAFRDKTQTTYRITPAMVSKFPNGVPFGANQNWNGNQTDHFIVISKYPLALTVHAGIDAGPGTFTTAWKPISTVVTSANTENWFAVDGTAEALTSITLAGLATSAGEAADEIHELIYETAFQAVA